MKGTSYTTETQNGTTLKIVSGLRVLNSAIKANPAFCFSPAVSRFLLLISLLLSPIVTLSQLLLLPGVISTEVGYSQGSVEEPSYEQVCSGTTGHAEVVQVTYDANQVRTATA